MARIKKATRERTKLRMAIDGPSGSGKTYTGLEFAFALSRMKGAALAGDKKVLVIDSEHGSASKYVGEITASSAEPWTFDTIQLHSFSPSEYESAITEAGEAGYWAILIDSLSHAWEGKDGALELKDKIGGNSYTAWKDITPMHRRMVESILASPAHVIATMRSKTEYVLEEEKGKQVPKRVGMAPVQRQGMEYEFDVYASLDWSHIMHVTKSRCRAVDQKIAAKPAGAFMEPIIAWLESGNEPATTNGRVSPILDPLIRYDQLSKILSEIEILGWTVDQAKKKLPGMYGVTEFAHLRTVDADAFVAWLETQAKVAAIKAGKPSPAAPATDKATATAAAATNGEPMKPEPAEPAPSKTKTTTTTAKVGFHLPDPGTILDEQCEAIKSRVLKLFSLGMTRETYRDKILAKRGVESAKDLSAQQAKALIDALQAKIEFMEATATAAGGDQKAGAITEAGAKN